MGDAIAALLQGLRSIQVFPDPLPDSRPVRRRSPADDVAGIASDWAKVLGGPGRTRHNDYKPLPALHCYYCKQPVEARRCEQLPDGELLCHHCGIDAVIDLRDIDAVLDRLHRFGFAPLAEPK